MKSGKHTHPQIEIVWIPGHFEIQGNERADAEAKKAAADSTLTQLRRHRPLKSARARYIKTSSKGTMAQNLERGHQDSQSTATYYKNKKEGKQNGPETV